MTKKMMTTVAIAAILAAAASAARATDQNIQITATTNPFCRISNSLTPADDTLDWTSLITAGFISATPTTKTYAVVCNKPSNITLTSVNGGLNTATLGAGGFDNIINYTASTSGFATVPTGSTASIAVAVTGLNEVLGTTSRPSPGSANINVLITPIVNTSAGGLVEGNYADTLKLTIVPQ